MPVHLENVPAAVSQLRALGFPVINIRLALPKLTGLDHKKIAGAVGTSDKNITAHLNDHRQNAIIQKRIAKFYGVPTEELFENE